jgi:hypothetical protein
VLEKENAQKDLTLAGHNRYEEFATKLHLVAISRIREKKSSEVFATNGFP